MAHNKRFGELLSEGIGSIARRQKKGVAAVQQEIAEALGYTHHNVQRWRRGHLPDEPDQVAFLARYSVNQGRVNRDWVQSLLIQARYSDRDTLLQELFPEQPQRLETPRIYQNLPPRYGDFLGREADMARVLEGLASRWPLISIEGLGGMGKTTLAIEAARRCLSDNEAGLDLPFEAVVWVSAKDRPEQKHWLNDVLDVVARVLDYPYITQLPAEQKPVEVDSLLRTRRTLVIVDNFETIEDVELEHWMHQVPEPSKVLLTSRYAQLRSVWAIHLRGLVEPEALELIRRHVQRLGLRTIETADEDVLLPLTRVVEGNPRAIEMALGYVKYGGLSLVEVVDHLYTASQSVGDIFDDLFARVWEALTEDARQMLLVVPFFVDTASKEALGAAAELKGYHLDTALGQLLEMSLLDIKEELGTQPRYHAHPLTRAFARNKLGEMPDWEQEAQERWVAWYTDFLIQHSEEDWPAFSVLDTEHENILAVIVWTLRKQHPKAPNLVQLFWHFLYVRGHWGQCETYTHQALEQAITQKVTYLRLWLASHLGWLFTEQHRNVEAKKWLHQVEKDIQALKQPDWLEETRVLNYLGQLYLNQNDLDRADAYQTQFLALAEQRGDHRNILVAHYYLAMTSFRRGRLEETERRYRSLVTEVQKIGWERGEGYCAYRLAEVLIHLARLEDAEYWLYHVDEFANRWQEPLLRAHILFGRACLQRGHKQPMEALVTAQAALDLYQRLGMRREKQKVMEIIQQLEKS